MIRLDLIRQAVASAPGTGVISLGSAQTGYIGIQDHPDTTDGMIVEYAIQDGNNKEFGIGTYSATGDTLTRTWIQGKIDSGVYSKNPGTGLTLSANAIVGCSPTATNLNFSGCLVFNSTDQSITTSTNTYLSFDSEVYDTNNFHETSTNNSRITIPKGISVVEVFCAVRWAANSTGFRVVELAKNNDASERGCPRHLISASNDTSTSMSSAPLYVSENDYFEVQVYQSSGSNLNVAHTDTNTYFGLRVIQ